VFAAVGIVLVRTYVCKTRPLDKAFTVEYLGRPELGPYYMDLTEKMVDHPRRDERGGILELYRPTGEVYFHPIKNTHYAFGLYAQYLDSGSTEKQQEFLKAADAIIASGVLREDGSRVWYYPHQYSPGQRTPWISAMAQGQVVGVMARAFELTGEARYLDCAREALVPFTKRIEEGGVCSDDQSLGVFYEEYAHAGKGYQHHTLNGMTSALFCIHDFWKRTGDEDARRLFDRGVATIRRNLPKYDFPFCSAYDLRQELGWPRPVFSAHYNAVHVAHLRVLARMTGDAYFEGVADCWDRKLRDPCHRLRLAWNHWTGKLSRGWLKLSGFTPPDRPSDHAAAAAPRAPRAAAVAAQEGKRG